MARVSTEFRQDGIPRNFLTSEVISAKFRRNSAKFRGIPRNFAGIAPEITSVFRGMPKCHFRGHPIYGALVRIRFLCFRLAVMSLNWVVITMCFYGLSLNSANNEVLIFLFAKNYSGFEKTEMSCERRGYWLAQNRSYLGQSICRKQTIVLNAKVKCILIAQLFGKNHIHPKENESCEKKVRRFLVCIVLVFAKNTMLGSWNPGGLSAKLKITLSFDHLLINLRYTWRVFNH